MKDIKFRAYVKDKNKIYDVKDIDLVYGFVRFEEEDKPTDTMRMFDQVELMQYTGLKDKNGKMVFEGDIIKTTYREVRDYMGVKYDSKMQFIEKVIWSDDYNGWYLEVNNCGINMYRRFNYCDEVNSIKLTDVEVIGNIYGNPELLKEIR